MFVPYAHRRHSDAPDDGAETQLPLADGADGRARVPLVADDDSFVEVDDADAAVVLQDDDEYADGASHEGRVRTANPRAPRVGKATDDGKGVGDGKPSKVAGAGDAKPKAKSKAEPKVTPKAAKPGKTNRI